MDLLRQKALNGDAYAMISLGDEYFRENNRTGSKEQAVFWYRKAAQKKLPLGHYRYGVCLEFGWGIPKAPRQAFEQYLAAGNFGAAQLRIAEMLLSGLPGDKTYPAVPQDKKKALELMRTLCRANYYPALMKLAKLLYQDPESRKTNGKEIYQLVLQSSNAHPVPPEVLVFQAKLLQQGIGIAPDPVFARALLEIAAKQKHPEAEFMFAEILEFGNGTKPDKKRAFEFYKRAAAAEFSPALVRMGDFHLEGFQLEQSPVKAVKFYEKAARKNFPPALRKLGWCCEKGIGRAKDLQQAFRCYERSADLGDPEGSRQTGRCFLEGVGVKSDPAAAVYYFRRSAALGDKEGVLALAECLRTGRGCTQDEAMAERIREAAEKL